MESVEEAKATGDFTRDLLSPDDATSCNIEFNNDEIKLSKIKVTHTAQPSAYNSLNTKENFIDSSAYTSLTAMNNPDIEFRLKLLFN